MANHPFIIGLGHRKRVGKDTFGKILFDTIAADTRIKSPVRFDSFANKMKHACHDIFGLHMPWHYEEHPEDKLEIHSGTGKTHRQIMIDFGCAVRDIDPDAWISALLRAHEGNRGIMIVTDVRFPNEAAICDYKIKVERASVAPTDDRADVALAGYDGWDMVIHNDGPMDSLCVSARLVADRIFEIIKNKHSLRSSVVL